MLYYVSNNPLIQQPIKKEIFDHQKTMLKIYENYQQFNYCFIEQQKNKKIYITDYQSTICSHGRWYCNGISLNFIP